MKQNYVDDPRSLLLQLHGDRSIALWSKTPINLHINMNMSIHLVTSRTGGFCLLLRLQMLSVAVRLV